MLFDFEKSEEKNFTETVLILAGMSKFIIADITWPQSCPLELKATIPNFKIPFVPIIQKNERPFSMFVDLQNENDHVLTLLEYNAFEDLVEVIKEAIIDPAIKLSEDLVKLKNQPLKKRSTDDYR